MRAALACGCVSAAAALAVVASCASDEQEAARDAGVEVGAAAPPVDGGGVPTADVAPREDAHAPLRNSCGDAGTFPDTWLADPRLCLTVFAANVARPRQMAFAPDGILFVVADGFLEELADGDRDGFIDDGERSRFAAVAEGTVELTHGVAFSPDGAFVYASSDTTVYRWPYAKGDKVASAPPEIVVANMPAGGGHFTRALVFDALGRLYVHVGSDLDVDTDAAVLASRSMVRRFTLPAAIPPGGVDYSVGEVFAYGLRNSVGLAFDSQGRMWGVDNGSDALGDDNPGEELNRLDGPGPSFFGYPHCWSEYLLDGGLGPGTQWSYAPGPSAPDDAWCQNPSNVRRPAAVMQGHSAPLGVAEYTGGSLPWRGDLLIALHGSTYRTTPVGRVLVRAHLDGGSVESISPVVGRAVDGGLAEGTWEVRPVDVRTGPDDAVYFSDDVGHRIFRLGYRP